MTTINIGAENASDPHYRYKMPKPISKVEGRGNGIKTNVVNNVDIAKALERPPEYILKFLGSELGAQTKFDTKTKVSIVNGSHGADVLMTHIESFIKKYVQCYSCGNPETVISVKKDNIHLKCKACGHISEVDMSHKFNNYILKNRPSSGLSKEEKKVRDEERKRLKALKEDKKSKSKDRKEEKASKKESKSSTTDLKSEGHSSSSKPEELARKDSTPKTQEVEEKEENTTKEAVVWHSDVSPEAIEKRAKEQLATSAVASLVTQGNIEAEASGAKKKLKKLLAKLEIPEDVISTINDLGVRLCKDDTPSAIEECLVSGISKAPMRMMALYLVLFWEAEQKLGFIVKENVELLKVFAKEPKDQLAQLFGLEYVMAMMIPEKMKELPQILKVLYDDDVVDDEIIIGWYSKPAASQKAVGVAEEATEQVRSICAEFAKWLQEEEEESESGDSESESSDSAEE